VINYYYETFHNIVSNNSENGVKMKASMAEIAKKAGLSKSMVSRALRNYKEISEGDILKHTFIIMNRGDQPLEIKRVKPA